jgi:hypothetical protein
MSKPWMPRIAIVTLLVAWSVSRSIPTKAQDTGVAEYARQSQNANKKAAKQQRKTWKKYVRAQRKALKKSSRHARYRTPPRPSV